MNSDDGHKKSCMGIDDEVLFCVFFLPGACRRRWISQKWRRRKCLENHNYPTGRIERDGRIICCTGNNEPVELLDCYNFCEPFAHTMPNLNTTKKPFFFSTLYIFLCVFLGKDKISSGHKIHTLRQKEKKNGRSQRTR